MRKNLIHAGLILIILAGTLWISPSASGRQAPQPPATTTVRVVSSDRTGITLEMTVPAVMAEPVTLAGERYDALTVPGCTPAAEPGHPALPRTSVLLGVPPGAELHVTTTALEAETLPGTYRVAPAPRWVVRKDGPIQYLEPTYAPDKTAYATTSLYPAEPAHVVHTGYVRSQRVVSLELTPLQYRPASGELRLIRRLHVRLGFQYPDGAARGWGTDRVEEPTFEGILSRSLLNYKEAQAWRADSSDSVSVAASPWAPPDPAWKVLVNRTGLYRLDRADLQAAGVPVDTLDPRTLQLHNQGAEVAIHVVGQGDGSFDEGDYLEFYGQALDTTYTDTNVYWLTHGGTAGLRMTARDGTPTDAPTPTAFTTTAHIEEESSYSQRFSFDDDHWFWKYMYAISPTHSITEPLSEVCMGAIGLVATDAHTCTVDISLHGTTYNTAVTLDHHALVYLNDHLIHDAWWDGEIPYSAMVEVPSTYLADLTNTFRVDMPADTGSWYDGIYVDGFTVEYRHPYRAVNDELAFTPDVTGTWQFRVAGFSDPDILTFDVTDPAHVVRITGGVSECTYRLFLPLVVKGYDSTVAKGHASPAAALPVESSCLLRFQDTAAGPADYLVLATSRARVPLAIVPDTPSNLADTANQADYVIIAHDDLYTSTLPLAAYWQTQGMTTTLVRISDVYDEFSYGILDPTAIRDFLAHAYTNWQSPQLAYVLLVGDGTYDYRHYTEFDPPSGIIPPYLLNTPDLGETGSDNWFACVSGSDYWPDLHIGRLPANIPAEVDVMVNKILGYAQSPPGGTWNQDVLFVADNADGAGNFPQFSDDLVNNYLPPAYTPHKVYYGITHTTQQTATLAITGTVNDGCLLVNYIGHGAIYLWAHEHLLYCHGSRCDFDDLSNGGKLPFVVSMTCMDGYYIHPDPAFTSLAQRWLLRDGGGAVAAFAPTGMGMATGHHVMNQRLFTAIFTDTLALGPATMEAKLALGGSYQDLVETYHLFGDPALALHLPP